MKKLFVVIASCVVALGQAKNPTDHSGHKARKAAQSGISRTTTLGAETRAFAPRLDYWEGEIHVPSQPPSPRLFAAGVISSPADDLSPAFMPDGKAVYFTRSNGSVSMIMVSRFSNGQWSSPSVAPFSGVWNDFEPTLSLDGSFLIFASNRPIDDQKTALDGHFNGKTIPGGGGNLWRVDRVGDSWSVPTRLPAAINAGDATFSPSIAADRSVYFMRPDPQTGNFHLYRSQYKAGSYEPAVAIRLGDDTSEEVDPAVAPDETFMIYSANHPAAKQPKRLRIVFRKGDGWGTSQDLGDSVNEMGSNIEARLSPDHRTLYFSTNTVPPADYPRSPEQINSDLSAMKTWANGRHNIWYVPLDPWLPQTLDSHGRIGHGADRE